MKKIWNRILAICLCALFLFGAIPFAVWEQFPMDFSGLLIRTAAADYSGHCGYSPFGTGTNLEWAYDPNTGCLTISGTGKMRNYRNSASSAPWGQYHGSIRSITIADGVTSIGKFAFTHCDSFTYIYLPDSVTEVGYGAFNECHGLTTVRFPAECSMKPTGGGSNYASFDGCVNLQHVILGGNVVSCNTFRGFSDKTTIQQIETQSSVQTIDADAFSGCTQLSRLTLGRGLLNIGNSAFYNCISLRTIHIPDTVMAIHENAFFNCTNLQRITVDPSNPRFSHDENGILFDKGKNTLIRFPQACSLTAYVLPDSVYTIGPSAFRACKAITDITLSDSVTTIGDRAFMYCTGLRNIVLGRVINLSGNAFRYCSRLEQFTVDKDNPQYCSDSNGVLYNKDKTALIQYPAAAARTEFKIPFGVTDIFDYAFYESTNLQTISFPDSVKSIGIQAFSCCTALTKAVFSEGITKIGLRAFSKCEALQEVELSDSIAEMETDVFEECQNVTVLCSANSYAQTYCEENNIPYQNYNYTQIYANPTIVRPQETVSIPVYAAHNTGFSGFAIYAHYDMDMFTPISVTAGELLSGGSINDSIGAMDNGVVKVLYTAGSGQSIAQNGLLFTMRFAVKEQAYGSQEIGLSYSQGDTFDVNFDNAVFRCANAKVQIDPDSVPHFYAQDMQVKAGQQVTVPVNVCGVSSMPDFSLRLSYDTSLLQLEKVVPINGELHYADDTLTCSSAASSDGLLAYLTFSAQESASGTVRIEMICSDDSAVCRSFQIRILPNQDPVVELPEMTAFSGETIVVPVSIRNNPGLMGIGLDVYYDDDVFTLLSVTKEDALAGGLYDWNTKHGCVQIVWSGSEESISEETLFHVELLVSRNLSQSEAEIAVVCNSADTFNEQWESLHILPTAAQIHLDGLEITGKARLFVGEQTKLTAAYRFGSVSHGELSYASSDPLVASVDGDGTVTALRRGCVQIFVQDENGGTALMPLVVLSADQQLHIFSFDDSFEQKVDWWKKYSTATMKLGFQSYNDSEAVRYVWSADSFRVDVDQQGNVTNTGCFARSAKITLTAYDAADNVVASASVTVRFYKFNWQYRRLQSQEIVSDNIFSPTVEPTETETETWISFVTAFLSKVFWLFIR